MKVNAVLITVALWAASWAGVACAEAVTATEISVDAANLAHCQAIGRAAPDGGNIRAYNACKQEAGLAQ